jgi:hypothetical protein
LSWNEWIGYRNWQCKVSDQKTQQTYCSC